MTPKQGTVLESFVVVNDQSERTDCNYFLITLLADGSIWEMTDTDKKWNKIS